MSQLPSPPHPRFECYRGQLPAPVHSASSTGVPPASPSPNGRSFGHHPLLCARRSHAASCKVLTCTCAATGVATSRPSWSAPASLIVASHKLCQQPLTDDLLQQMLAVIQLSLTSITGAWVRLQAGAPTIMVGWSHSETEIHHPGVHCGAGVITTHARDLEDSW